MSVGRHIETKEESLMKKRIVLVTLELETDVPLKDLKDKTEWQKVAGFYAGGETAVHQVTATVQQPVTQVRKTR
jgi:predicted RNA-binding protein with PUA-like domain